MVKESKSIGADVDVDDVDVVIVDVIIVVNVSCSSAIGESNVLPSAPNVKGAVWLLVVVAEPTVVCNKQE